MHDSIKSLRKKNATVVKHDVPEKPWTKKVAVALIYHRLNENYFLLIDYTSKCFEVHRPQNPLWKLSLK